MTSAFHLFLDAGIASVAGDTGTEFNNGCTSNVKSISGNIQSSDVLNKLWCSQLRSLVELQLDDDVMRWAIKCLRQSCWPRSLTSVEETNPANASFDPTENPAGINRSDAGEEESDDMLSMRDAVQRLHILLEKEVSKTTSACSGSSSDPSDCNLHSRVIPGNQKQEEDSPIPLTASLSDTEKLCIVKSLRTILEELSIVAVEESKDR
jgi:hypothetical protein